MNSLIPKIGCVMIILVSVTSCISTLIEIDKRKIAERPAHHPIASVRDVYVDGRCITLVRGGSHSGMIGVLPCQ